MENGAVSSQRRPDLELKKAKYFFQKCGQKGQLELDDHTLLKNYLSIKECNTVVSVHLGNDRFDASYCCTDGALTDLFSSEQVEPQFIQKRASCSCEDKSDRHIDCMMPPAQHRMVTKDGRTIGEIQSTLILQFFDGILKEIEERVQKIGGNGDTAQEAAVQKAAVQKAAVQATAVQGTAVQEAAVQKAAVQETTVQGTEVQEAVPTETATAKSQAQKLKVLLILSIPDTEIWQLQREKFTDFIFRTLRRRIPREHIMILTEAECTYHYVCGVKKMDPGPVRILDLGHISFSAVTCSGTGRLMDQKTFLFGGNRIESVVLRHALERYNRNSLAPVDWDDISNLKGSLLRVREIKEERCMAGGSLQGSHEITLHVKRAETQDEINIYITEEDFDHAFSRIKYQASQPGFPEMEGTYMSLIRDFLEEAAGDSDRAILTGGVANEIRNSSMLHGILDERHITLMGKAEDRSMVDYNKRITEGALACIRSAFLVERELRKFESEAIPKAFESSQILSEFSNALAAQAAKALWENCYLSAIDRFKNYREDICFGTVEDVFNRQGRISFYSLFGEEVDEKEEKIEKDQRNSIVGLSLKDICGNFRSIWNKCAAEECKVTVSGKCAEDAAGIDATTAENICKKIIGECLWDELPQCMEGLRIVVSQFELNRLLGLFSYIETKHPKTEQEREKAGKTLTDKAEKYKNALTRAIAKKYEDTLKESQVAQKAARKLSDYLLEHVPFAASTDDNASE